uniref:DDE Tnp4 domain-containing protein n=1 Tax=Ditylenchus dipsaci TaxID=166011 RepID=A0A915E0A5_9BILA
MKLLQDGWLTASQTSILYTTSTLHSSSKQDILCNLWRYYNSPDERDLVRFLRITKPKFDQLYTKLQDQLDAHCPTHLRPINGIIRLAIFLRCKSVSFNRPDNSGSIFYNYKKFYSIVLLAIADAESRFIAVDIGAAGRNSDATRGILILTVCWEYWRANVR